MTKEYGMLEEVRDSLTGFEGKVTARCEYLTGCVQYEVTPLGLHEGVPTEARWFDWQRLTKKLNVKKKTEKTHVGGSGGPGNHPPTRSHPA